jgi:hypothetical protein
MMKFSGTTLNFVLFLREDGVLKTGVSYLVKTIQLTDLDWNVLYTDAGPYTADSDGRIEINGTLLSTPARGTPLALKFLADFDAVTDVALIETMVYL